MPWHLLAVLQLMTAWKDLGPVMQVQVFVTLPVVLSPQRAQMDLQTFLMYPLAPVEVVVLQESGLQALPLAAVDLWPSPEGMALRTASSDPL